MKHFFCSLIIMKNGLFADILSDRIDIYPQ